ncbi:MAG: hypothetical protein V7731_16170 [Amphritea sp.]
MVKIYRLLRDNDTDDKKDYLGDFVLWSLGIGVAGIVLAAVTSIKAFGALAAIALGGFGLFMAAAVIFRVFDFGCEMKEVWQKASRRRSYNGKRR